MYYSNRGNGQTKSFTEEELPAITSKMKKVKAPGIGGIDLQSVPYHQGSRLSNSQWLSKIRTIPKRMEY